MKRFLSLGLILMVLLSCGLGEKAQELQEIAENLEEASKNLESGDTTAAEEAFSKLLGGGEKVEPVDFRKLKELLPETLAGLPRTSSSGEKTGMMGMRVSKAEAEYRSEDGQQRLKVTITDMGSVRGIGMLGINWLMVEVDKETDNGYERTTKYRDHPAYEKFQQNGDRLNGETNVFVAERFIVAMNGTGLTMETINDARDDLGIRQLEAMKDEGVGEDAAAE